MYRDLGMAVFYIGMAIVAMLSLRKNRSTNQ